jgi:hypothetical protein
VKTLGHSDILASGQMPTKRGLFKTKLIWWGFLGFFFKVGTTAQW